MTTSVPQHWTAPPAPDESVTHVRDARGIVWRRDGHVWWADVGNGYEQYRTWWELLSRSPLTDSTGSGD